MKKVSAKKAARKLAKSVRKSIRRHNIATGVVTGVATAFVLTATGAGKRLSEAAGEGLANLFRLHPLQRMSEGAGGVLNRAGKWFHPAEPSHEEPQHSKPFRSDAA